MTDSVSGVPGATPSLSEAVQAEAAKVEVAVAAAAPAVVAAVAADINKPGKFSKANLRRVALSALKAFAVGVGVVVVAKLKAGGQFDVSTVEADGFAALVAGGGALAKVVEVFLED